jgi:hypothetical protein
MAIKTTTISNISKQPVGVLFTNTQNPAAGDVPVNDKGIMTIQPGKSVTIESNRIDAGQLQNFATKNLVKVTQGAVD